MRVNMADAFYEIGDTRICRYFAFIPVQIGDDKRWLEVITVQEKYLPAEDWRIVKFMDTTPSERISCGVTTLLGVSAVSCFWFWTLLWFFYSGGVKGLSVGIGILFVLTFVSITLRSINHYESARKPKSVKLEK